MLICLISTKDAQALKKLCARAVVKEALRHGIGTSSRLSRIAPDESFDVADPATGKSYHIPAGTIVSMSLYRTIIDKTIFSDPLGFHPER